MEPSKRLWKSSKWLVTRAAGCFLLLPTSQAQAHTTFPGLGEYASGFLHPLTTPLHLLVLVALGIWLGQRAPLRIKYPTAVFAVATAGGLWSTTITKASGAHPPLLIVIGLCAGFCVAVGASGPPLLKIVVCGVAALLIGLDSGVETGIGTTSQIKVLTATWASLVLCLINGTFYVSLLPAARWAQTGLQVVGSWIVAICFLLLAFALRH